MNIVLIGDSSKQDILGIKEPFQKCQNKKQATFSILKTTNPSLKKKQFSDSITDNNDPRYKRITITLNIK